MRLPAVWACVQLLATTVSTLPMSAYRQGETEPIPTPGVLAQPGADMATHEWLHALMSSLLLRGNAYGLITARSGATLTPSQVELVHPDLVGLWVDPTTQARTYRIGGRAFDADEVWHLRAFTMPGVALGLSPIEYARQTIGLGIGAQKFGAKFFADDGRPYGVLTTDQVLGPNETRMHIEHWKQFLRDNNRTGLLSQGITYQPLSVKPDESQFLDTQQVNTAEIARVFGLSPEMIGAASGASLTYANVESRAADFVRYSLRPWLVRMEEGLSALLPRGQTVEFDTRALLRGTTNTRYEAHKIGLDAGFLTVSEVREMEGLPPLDNPPAGQPATVQEGDTS